MERHFIDTYEDRDICGDLKLKVHLDPIRNRIQEQSFVFPWIYRIRSTVKYLEELEPERRILDAYLKGQRISKDTILFKPYKKPYTSCILRKFVTEDPYDPKRAILKYCREKPLRFVIFSKPGLNVDSLAIEISKYWGCLHISPPIAVNNTSIHNIAEKTRHSLLKGKMVSVNDIIIHVKEQLNGVESKKRGYVLTGLPMRHRMDSEFHLLEQMEMIFETENRPDIIIYVSSPSTDIHSLNDNGFIIDLRSGFYFNKIYIKDAIKLHENDGLKLEDLEKSYERDYNYFLLKELANYNAAQRYGLNIHIDKLPCYSADLVEDYVKKILPIIDSYILEYDSQCLVKLDGRIPVANMIDIVKAKLLSLPYIPICKAKPIFQEMIESQIDVDISDNRSEDSILEDGQESELEEEDDKEMELGEEEEDESAIEQEEEVVHEEAGEGDETMPEKKVNKELQHLNNMVPKEALRRLKDYNKVDPNFKWSESDYGVHCPVEFERGNICLGEPKYTCTYLGKLYMMSSLDAMHEFLFDPNRYVIPPKPLPTFKIFVVGPPWSGKSTVIKSLSEFFNLKVINTKKLIEEICGKNFFDMEIRELVRKQKKLGKVQDVEDKIFDSYEQRRCTDILHWIREQLPYIYQRIKFTSLIEVPIDDESTINVEAKDENEEEVSEGEDIKEELILPMQEGFIETINRLTKPDLKTIIALKKYTLDLPLKSGYEKLYENIDTDQHSMLVKAISYEDANISMKQLKEEFKERGLDFYLNTEDYVGIILNPAHLLSYLPNQYRQPYYSNSSVEYDDPRVKDPLNDDIGITTEFGFISVNREELIDKLEKTILDIEAENNLRQKGDDLQIGGWLVDDIPLDKKFWKLLVKRYLLPDDIIIRTVSQNSHDKVIKNFCAVIGNDETNDLSKQETTQNTTVLSCNGSEESLKDVETNRFLVVRNSFLQVNRHYEREFEYSDNENVPKTCKIEKEQSIVTQEVLDELPKMNETIDKEVKYKYSTKQTAGLHATKAVWENTIENPFNLKMLPMKPFHLNFWDDNKFLVEIFQEITEYWLHHQDHSIEVHTIYAAENSAKTSMIDSSTDVRKVTDSKKHLKPRTSCSSERLKTPISKESISSSDTSIGKVIPRVIPEKKGYLRDKTRLSLMKKQKTDDKHLTVYAAAVASRNDGAPPESLFELHNKDILGKPKIKSKEYNLFEIFYREIQSHIAAEPLMFELKYLTEIKTMLANGASLVEVANTMMKYLRKVKKPDESQDNVLLKRPTIDIAIDKHKRLKAASVTMDVISHTDTRGQLRRTGSNIKLEQSDSQGSMKGIHKASSISRISNASLINESTSQYLKRTGETLGSKILCYKDSNEDIYKSSSILLNVETLPSDRSLNPIPERNEGWGIRLPKIDGTKTKMEQHSCYCLHPQKGEDICLCSSSSSNSEIEAERKKNRLCIWDESSLTIFPWIPVEEQIRALRPEEKVEPLRRGRQKTEIRTMMTIDKEQKEMTQKSTPNITNLIDENCEYIEFTENEEQDEDETYTVPSSYEEQTATYESSTHDITERYRSDSNQILETFKEKYVSEDHINDIENLPPVNLKSDSTTDILHDVTNKSLTSLLYKTSIESIVNTKSATQINQSQDKNKILSNEISEEDLSYLNASEVRYRSEDTMAMTLINMEGFDSNMLLPGFQGNEWDRFKNFVNSMYLSASTYTDIGFNTDTHDNFYLECCPSTSDISVKDYEERPSVMMKRFRNRWSRYMKSEAMRLTGHVSMENIDEEDICLLEVALPMPEAQLNTALTTTLKCLMLGKTISQLFSANKHDKVGQQRLTTSALNLMYEDDTVKDLKTASESFGLDQHSDVMPIDDVSSMDAIFDKQGQLVQDNRCIELYDGNLLRYRSLDQRFRPSLEMLSDSESDSEQDNETDHCPEIFMSTVPRAILHVPYVVPRFRPITKNKRVKPEHLRRYYSLQSMCRLVCVDSDHECSKPTEDTEGEHKEEEEEALTFRYILKKEYTKTFKSIYIHRPTSVKRFRRKSQGHEEELIQEEQEEEEEEEEEEESGEEEEEEVAELKLIQNIIEPLIDVFREEIAKAEMSEHLTKPASDSEHFTKPTSASKTKSVSDSKIKLGSVTLDSQPNLRVISSASKHKHISMDDLESEEEILTFSHDLREIPIQSHHKNHISFYTETNEILSEPDEIENEIEKNLTFSYPFDIIKLMFQKYDFITMQTSEDDLDEMLITELNNIKPPKRFQCFLQTFDYNVRHWLDEWEAFKTETLSNIHCNLIELEFVPSKHYKLHLANSVTKLLHDYQPQAECVDINKEKLIKTINLETADIEVDEIEELTDIATDITETKERDIGDVEICELLPNELSDFHPYCPVIYKKTNELIPVNNLYNVEYREKYFNFSTEDDMNEFIKMPEHYSVVKEYDYDTTPIRICMVAPRDLDETLHIGRSLADLMALPFKTLTTEIKRIRGKTLNLPVGILDEDQTNIKLFSLDETNEDPQQDTLENTEWDHIRNYFNFKTPLTDNELEALIKPLWKVNYGHVFHAFPHTFEDFQYMVKTKTIPDAVVFIDVEDQRKVRRKDIEDRIKTRQLLNFGARLKRLLSADHIRYRVWKEAYPKLFNIVLRKFLRERRAERNFRERLNLVLPTLMTSQISLEESEEELEYEDVRAWDVEWLLYQVEGKETNEVETTSDDPSKILSALEIRKNKKYINVLDDPNINEEDKNKLLQLLQRQKTTVELFNQTTSPPELLIEEQEAEGESVDAISLQKEFVNLSDIEFPDLKSIFESSNTNISEDVSLGEDYEKISKLKDVTKRSDDLITESEEQMNAGIKLVNRRQAAMTNMFDPPFQKKYLPKFRPVIYKSQRPFNEEDYKKNVTDASSTSFLGHDETDSIETRELTSSLSLLDVESRNKQLRLMQLVLGNKIALKDHFMNIVNQLKDSHPTPPSNARKLKPVSFKNLTKQMKEYYKTEKEHVKQMKDLCEIHNIPYVIHKSRSHIKYLAQNVKNVIRKPHALERVFIVNYKTANKLLENGNYFLSRFGYWCPVQLYEQKFPFQDHYSNKAKENIIIPIIHKRYIYFLNGRNSAIKFSQSPLKYIKQHNMMTFFPVKIAITGLQKSNKTSLAKNLAKQHGLKYVSVDLTIHYVVKKLYWSDLAKNILAELQKGETVSNLHTIKCIEAFMNGSSKCLKYGWVLDGYPNTIDELILMRENDIVPNVIFGMEPAEDHIKDIFSNLNDDRTTILNDFYKGNEFVDIENDEKEDTYYESMRKHETTFSEAGAILFDNNEVNEKQIDEVGYDDEEEEEEEDYGNEMRYILEETPENIYTQRIKKLLSAKHSTPIEPILIPDFDQKLIDFELNSLLPPVQIIEMRILLWLEKVKSYDRVIKTAISWWGNSYKLEWTKDTKKLLERMNEILSAFIWALQDYNLKIAKGLPVSLYLTGITEDEFQLHRSPFNECCPGCWYYHRIYFRCPTCLFKDMMPGMIQYDNYFYWLCILHYDMFMSNPVKFLMSYESVFSKNYPQKTVIGDAYLENNLNVQYKGLCITCYYNHLPELKHVKGLGKFSVIINKTNIYLFCSNKCVCEMLMRPTRYLNLDIEYADKSRLPQLRNLNDNKVTYKRVFEQLVSEAIYDSIRKFLFMRPKLFKLSHKTSACTYLALNLKLKAEHITRCEMVYYKGMLKYMEKHCQEVETFCKNIDQIFAFHSPLSIIEQTKAKCLPPDIEDILVKNLLPQHRRKKTKKINKQQGN